MSLVTNFNLALKWVQSNIAAYGGDKDNVTIFGESAGGWSVESLLSSRHTVGYFHKAIAQSGSLLVGMIDNNDLRTAAFDFARGYFKVETNEAMKEALEAASPEQVLEFYKAIPQALGTGFTGTVKTRHRNFSSKAP